MAIGKGRYDIECTDALVNTQAQAVILIVLGGDRGSGFSVSGRGAKIQRSIIPQLPKVLRQVADQIEADVKAAARQ